MVRDALTGSELAIEAMVADRVAKSKTPWGRLELIASEIDRLADLLAPPNYITPELHMQAIFLRTQARDLEKVSTPRSPALVVPHVEEK